MNNSVIGLDIAKNIFHMYTFNEEKSKPVKKKLKRAELLSFFANYPISLIGIEACGGAHHWARELTKQGHDVLLNARYVKSFVVGNKNDFNDAAGIFDAVSRPNKRTVSIKTIEQQDIQLVHKIREGLVGKRTTLVNQTRGLLSERGIIIPQGIKKVRVELPLILEDAKNDLTDLSREMFAEQYEKLVVLDEEIKNQDRRISRLSNKYPSIIDLTFYWSFFSYSALHK